MATNHRRSKGAMAASYLITVVCVAIILAGLLTVAVLAAKGLWWALTC